MRFERRFQGRQKSPARRRRAVDGGSKLVDPDVEWRGKDLGDGNQWGVSSASSDRPADVVALELRVAHPSPNPSEKGVGRLRIVALQSQKRQSILISANRARERRKSHDCVG